MAAWKSQGKLSETTFPWLLVVLFAQKKTGILELQEGNIHKKIHFQDGLIVFASSDDTNDRLGELLLRRGMLTFVQLQTAISHIGGKERFGGILVRENFLSPQQLIWAVKEQIREIVLSVFPWTFGDYSFHEQPLTGEEMITLELPLELLVKEGIGRLDRWADVFEGAGPLEDKYTLLTERERAIPLLKPTDAEKEILDILKQGCTGLELVEKSPLTDFETLKFMWAAKVVRIVVSEAKPIVDKGEEDIIAALLDGIMPFEGGDDLGGFDLGEEEDTPSPQPQNMAQQPAPDSMPTPLPGSLDPVGEVDLPGEDPGEEDLSLQMPGEEPVTEDEADRALEGLDLDFQAGEEAAEENAEDIAEDIAEGEEPPAPVEEPETPLEIPPETEPMEIAVPEDVPEMEEGDFDQALSFGEGDGADSMDIGLPQEGPVEARQEGEAEAPKEQEEHEEPAPQADRDEAIMEMETTQDGDEAVGEVPLDQVGFDMEGMELETFDEEPMETEMSPESPDAADASTEGDAPWVEGSPTLDAGLISKAIEDLNIYQKYLNGFLQVEVGGRSKALVMKAMNQVGRHNSALFFKILANMDGTFPEGSLAKNVMKNRIADYTKLFNLLLEEQLMLLGEEAGEDRARVLRQGMRDLKERSGI